MIPSDEYSRPHDSRMQQMPQSQAEMRRNPWIQLYPIQRQQLPEFCARQNLVAIATVFRTVRHRITGAACAHDNGDQRRLHDPTPFLGTFFDADSYGRYFRDVYT